MLQAMPGTEVSFILRKIVKKDPGRARQKSLATAGTNFTKLGFNSVPALSELIAFAWPRLLA